MSYTVAFHDEDQDDIGSYPNAVYNVKLVLDYMVVHTVVNVERIEGEDENTLADRVVEIACSFLDDHYGVDFLILGITDAEITLEGITR